MSSPMTYKGYEGAVEYDGAADTFHGRVLGIRDVVTFQGRSVDELRQTLADSVDDYLAFCTELTREPEHPTAERDGASEPGLRSREARSGTAARRMGG